MATRRGNQEGSITLRKDGLWVGRLSAEGKRYSVYGKTKEAARLKLRALQRKQDQGLPLTSSRTPLEAYLVEWLESIKHQVSPKTHADYSDTVRCHISPQLGYVALGKLSPEHVAGAWRAMLKAGASPSVVQHCHARLSKALNDAMKRGLVYRNVTQAVTPPRPERKAVRPPDAAAIHRLLHAARATEYYEVLHTALYTGMRRNELLGLRWRDIDLYGGTISVAWSIYRAKGGHTIYQHPKTHKSQRSIALTPSSVLVLKALRERQEADGLLRGYEVNQDTSVFRYRNGFPILPRALSGAFRKIMLRTGLEGYRLHDTRHAHASLMLRQGIHPKIVSERLGHSRVSITLDTYSHVVPGLQEAAALRFDQALAVTEQEKPLYGRVVG
jgi:integrase